MKKKLKKYISDFKIFCKNVKGWRVSWWQLHVSPRDIIFSFYGFDHFEKSQKYADKRTLRNGLRHYVLPAGRGSEQLIVFNSRELKDLKRGGFVNKRVTIEVLLRESYYFTPKDLKRKIPKTVGKNFFSQYLIDRRAKKLRETSTVYIPTRREKTKK